MNESIETLAGGTPVYINETHRFGTDAMLLSAFCVPRRDEIAVDLCSGCGIVALRWHDFGHRGVCHAVELFAGGTALLQKAIATDAALAHILPQTADLNTLPATGTAHLVAANPPYFTGGAVSQKPHRAPARHEGEAGCTLEQVAAAAARLLRQGGRFAICQRPDQLARVCAVLTCAGLQPKRLCLVKQTQADVPWLFLLEAQKGRKPGLRILQDLCMADTAAVQRIYQNGEF